MKTIPRLFTLILFLLISGTGLATIGGGDVALRPEKANEVVFSHEKHVGNMDLKCTDCHDALFITKGRHKKVTMAQMQKGQSCGACHNGKVAFAVKANCSNCHMP